MENKLRTPQVRVLQALVDALLEGRECLTRQELNEACGLTTLSGTLTRAFHGLREGSSSGAAHLGLFALGMVEEVTLDIDGTTEVVYRITDAGREALAGATVAIGTRDKASSINKRYRKDA